MRKNVETKRYMRFSQQEKYDIIRLIERSDLSANRTLKELGLHKRTFYNWYARYLKGGYDGLASRAKGRRQTWNKIPQQEKIGSWKKHWNTLSFLQGNLPSILLIIINGISQKVVFIGS